MHCDCLVSAESEKVHRNECRSIGYFEEFVLKKTSFKMNTAPFESDPTQRKKAVHVKWAGKTIALGTFPVAEADEKCARAKALTRAWRSTMRPKPSREWVMLELERLGVRVVSGKVSGGDDGGDQNGSGAPSGTGTNAGAGAGSGRAEGTSGISNVGAIANAGAIGGGGAQGGAPPHRPLVGGGAAAAYEAARADHYGSMSEQQSNSAIPGGIGDQPNRLSDMMGGGLGGVGVPPGATAGGMSTGGMAGLGVNPNQHYEMLKLHHMNLLNEIQETTLMMNLYQQQHLQQQQLQQQQLQQHEASEQGKGGMGQPGVSMNQPMAGPASGVTVGGAGGLAQGIAPGMGQTIGATVPQQQGQAQPPSQSILAAQPPVSQQQQQQSQQQPQVQQKASTHPSAAPMAAPPSAPTEPKDTVQKATEDAEEQLRKLKAEIAERKRQMKALEAAAVGEGNIKRKVDGEGDDDQDTNTAKRSKTD